jgi:hypothetical protein
MEIVSSIGGLFFRTRDPESLGKWYLDRLGINLVPGDYDTLPWQQVAGPCAFSPFREDSKYFPADKRWMVNFRVRSLDVVLAQLREAGITVEIDPESYPNGRFAASTIPNAFPSNCGNPPHSQSEVRSLGQAEAYPTKSPAATPAGRQPGLGLKLDQRCSSA